MIKIHNMGEDIISINQIGTVANQTAWGTVWVPYSGWLAGIAAIVDTAGTGNNNNTSLLTVNMIQNGANMFGNNNIAPITFANNSRLATYDAKLSGLVTVKKGDTIRFDTTNLYNGTGASQAVGLTITVKISKTPPPGGLITGDVAPFDN